jgi:hypothetical protein
VPVRNSQGCQCYGRLQHATVGIQLFVHPS